MEIGTMGTGTVMKENDDYDDDDDCDVKDSFGTAIAMENAMSVSDVIC